LKIALLQCPVWWTVDPPLGLAQIAGVLAHHGHEVQVHDLNILLAKSRVPGYEHAWDWERFHEWNDPVFVRRFYADHARIVGERLQSILKSDARLIGFSVCAGGKIASLELARRIKAEDPSRVTVFGGQQFFSQDSARALLEDPAVDAVLRGPGDEVFPALAAGLEAKGELPALAGMLVRREGRVIDGGPPRMLKDLDALPFADFSGFPLELYDVQERLPIQASRGCVWDCRFCSSKPLWGGYASMSGERVFAELLAHKKRYPWKTHFEFYDLTANGDVRALGRLAELICEDRRVNGAAHFFGWKINAILRPEMEPGLLACLRKSNCHDVIYGVESASPAVLKRMNKPFSISTAERVLRDTHAAGITTVGNFMFGFPGETEEDFQQTLDFLRRNHASFDRVYGSATFTSLEEGSALAARPEDFGIRRMVSGAQHHLYWETEDGKNDYLVRLDRYERFRRLAIELGIDAYKGIDGSLDEERARNVEQYRRFRCEVKK
jgi:radical SAM superfamily enzyme YgiQ (UPF0313 family)